MKSFTPDLLSGNIILSRVRLARNLSEYPFRVTNETVAKKIIKDVNRALIKADTFKLYYVSNLSDLTLASMKEKYLISQNLIENKKCGAVLINEEKNVSIMINEEDIIREQCFKKGLGLSEAYKKLCAIDNELDKYLDIAYSEKFGYLTACITNVGTGLRASAMLFLPALTISGKLVDIAERLEECGLTVRGAYGEDSSAEGYIYQVSNEITIGESEREIIKSVEDCILEICELERKETESIFGGNDLKAMDVARKSFGILTNSVLLSYSEFLTHIGEVKLGAMLGVLDISNISELDDLIIAMRPANLCERYGKFLSANERDIYRAEIVGKKLLKLKGDIS